MGRKANIPSKETEQYLLENLRYDPETGHLWWIKPNNPARKLTSPAGSLHKSGYVWVTLTVGKITTKVAAHRVGWFLYYGKWPKEFIDHIDDNKSNNKIHNLREASEAQNQACRKKRLVTNSQFLKAKNRYAHPTYIGVRRSGKCSWSASCGGNYLGVHETPEKAALAYNRKALELYGEYAQQNNVDLPKESCHTD